MAVNAPINLQPIGDFLVVELHPVPEEGRIVLPHGVTRDAVPLYGTVLAQGPGYVLSSGALHPMPCQPGDTVLLQINAGTEVKLEGRTVRIVPARDLFGVIPA
jgi:co-chaperonin GroES (HSP10)